MPKIKFTNIQFESVIGDLVEARRKDLGLTKPQLASKLGYANIGKGCRQYDEFIGGNVELRFILENLPLALSLPTNEVSSALKITRQNIVDAKRQEEERIEAEWRRAFRVHGIIETERTIPQPIFIAALTGSVSLKFVELASSTEISSYTQQMIDEIQNRLCDNRAIIVFGKPIGFLINLSPDHAIRYDLEGNILEELEATLQLGLAYLKS